MEDWLLFVNTEFSSLILWSWSCHKLCKGWHVSVCLQCRYRTNPRLAGVSSLVDTAANAHMPRFKLLSPLATGRKGGLNRSKRTWEWLALPSSYALHSPSCSFSFLHSDEPELLILQPRHCVCTGGQNVNGIGSESTLPLLHPFSHNFMYPSVFQLLCMAFDHLSRYH